MRGIGLSGLAMLMILRAPADAGSGGGTSPDDSLASMLTLDGGASISLADLANLNMDTVAEVRFENVPVGRFLWKGTEESKITIVDMKDENSKPIKVGVIQFEAEVIGVYGAIMQDATGANIPQPDEAMLNSLIGRKHREAFFVKDTKAVGRAKALLKDAGISLQVQGPDGKPTGRALQDCIADFANGHKFRAPVRHQRDKNDTDKVYAHLDLNKIQPAPAA